MSPVHPVPISAVARRGDRLAHDDSRALLFSPTLKTLQSLQHSALSAEPTPPLEAITLFLATAASRWGCLSGGVESVDMLLVKVLML